MSLRSSGAPATGAPEPRWLAECERGDDGRPRRARAGDAARDEGGLRRRAALLPRARQAHVLPSRPPTRRGRRRDGGASRRRADVPGRRPGGEGAAARQPPRCLLHDAALQRVSGGADADPTTGAPRPRRAARPGGRRVAHARAETRCQGAGSPSTSRTTAEPILGAWHRGARHLFPVPRRGTSASRGSAART